ncbi:hypothetical protein AMECASPLE_005754 [Ameca splendens]|uniref:Uncharacterized protein n=1 Tax=Ameca splendens TaxID=208324 RepID=A0ABV0ZW26_9TELE
MWIGDILVPTPSQLVVVMHHIVVCQPPKNGKKKKLCRVVNAPLPLARCRQRGSASLGFTLLNTVHIKHHNSEHSGVSCEYNGFLKNTENISFTGKRSKSAWKLWHKHF